MGEKEIPKKIKRPEHIDITVNSKHARRTGRKKLEDKPLTEEMMNFAWLIGSGMDSKIAGRKLGFSDHKIKAYLELDALQEQVEKTKALRTKKELKQWKDLDEDLRIMVVTKAVEIMGSKTVLSKEETDYVKFLLAEWEKKTKSEGINIPQLVAMARKSITATQTTVERKSEKQLTYTPDENDEVDFNDDDSDLIEVDNDEYTEDQESEEGADEE